MTAGVVIGAEAGSYWVVVIMATCNCLEEWLWWRLLRSKSFVYSRNLVRWLQSGRGKTRLVGREPGTSRQPTEAITSIPYETSSSSARRRGGDGMIAGGMWWVGVAGHSFEYGIEHR